MIKKVLRNLSVAFITGDNNRHLLNKYNEMVQTDGWKIYQGLLIQVTNDIATYMFSPEFTSLTPEEKDTQQRALVGVKEVIDFLINPLKGAESWKKIQDFNKKMESTHKKGRNRK